MTTSSSERLLAFVAQWEYECCGDPLQVGEAVDLTLTSVSKEPLPGPDGRPVSHHIEHHVSDDPMRHVRARVVGVWEERIRHEQRDGVWYPVAATAEFTPIRRMAVWEQQWQPTNSGARPTGWVVELDVIDELPPLPDGGMYGA